MKRFTSAAPVRGFCDQRGTLGDTNWAVVITYSAILGRVIRTQRELRKVDLSDMSKRLGFASVSSSSRLETGDVPITVNALSAIARALAIKPAALVAMADELAKTHMPAAAVEDKSGKRS